MGRRRVFGMKRSTLPLHKRIRKLGNVRASASLNRSALLFTRCHPKGVFPLVSHIFLVCRIIKTGHLTQIYRRLPCWHREAKTNALFRIEITIPLHTSTRSRKRWPHLPFSALAFLGMHSSMSTGGLPGVGTARPEPFCTLGILHWRCHDTTLPVLASGQLDLLEAWSATISTRYRLRR